MKIKKLMLMLIALAMAFPALAQEAEGYYDAAINKKDKALLTALGKCIATSTKVSYDGLWEAYRTTDNNGGYYWDMYATTKFPLGQKHCGNYSQVGDCVNREHSFPKSWWGSTKDERFSDLFHLYPTDGFVNNQRSSYPFGECANGTYLDANGTNRPLGKLGYCTFPSSYTGKVFEPDDEYKGDFARSYFYMAVRYYDKGFSSYSGGMCGEENYLAFKDWAVELLMKWHRQDPVSPKEIDRNNAVKLTNQGNRNPFIDHPELAEHIWGDRRGQVWLGTTEPPTPMLVTPSNSEVIDFGNVAVNTTTTKNINIQGRNLSQPLTITVSGEQFSCTTTTLTADQANAGATVAVTFNAPGETTLVEGSLSISSPEFNSAVTATLKAQAIDGIPALEATDVTTSSFRARWTPLGDATNYTLSVYGEDGETLVEGYPKTVTASTGSYLVTGLEHSSTYYYQLTSQTLRSNVVEVQTLEPDRIISIQIEDEELVIGADKGQASEIKSAEVYTEYIEEDIDLTVSGNFEISLDKKNWSKSLTIDPQGESFFIRIADTSTEGEFDGELVASTATLDGYSLDVLGIITDPSAAPESVMEGFETCSTGGYWDKEVQGDMCAWDFSNAGVWADPHRDGSQSCRLGKTSTSSITMLEDFTSGASEFSFLAAPFGSDNDATLTVYYSTDEGSSWTKLEEFTVSGASNAPATGKMKAANINGMNEYNATLNVRGKIRFRIAQSAGSRVNIDDVTITAYKKPAAIDNIVDSKKATERGWDAWSGNGAITLESSQKAKFHIYNMDAREVAKTKVNGKGVITLPAGVYIVTDGKSSQKVIVK